jgi:tetratricopeptide (TPR) repeat protein
MGAVPTRQEIARAATPRLKLAVVRQTRPVLGQNELAARKLRYRKVSRGVFVRTLLYTPLLVLLGLISLHPQLAIATDKPGLAVKDGAAKQESYLHEGLAATDYFENLNGLHKAISLAELNAAITKNPHSPDGYIHRGNAQVLEGDLDSAIKDFNQALRFDPHSARAHIGLSRAYQASTDWAPAFSELRKAAEIGSKTTSVNALWESAFVHRELKQYDVALKQFDIVINSKILSPASQAYAILLRAETYMRMGKPKEGFADVTAGLKLDPHLLQLYIAQARALTALGKYQQAVSNYDRVISFFTKKYPSGTMGAMRTNLATLYNERSRLYTVMGRKDLAREDMILKSHLEKETINGMLFRMPE